MPYADQTPSDTSERAAFIHREIVQLVILVAIAVVAFFLTKAVAANNRAVSLRDAEKWFRQGQVDIAAGKLDRAVDAFHRATVRNRTDRRYLMALARALALKGDYDAARSVLLTLRETAPEDPDVNLALARLAAERQDVTEATRFYHNALYAPWPSDQSGAPISVRLELIRFLLTHDQSARALSELLAASTSLPPDSTAHLQVAQLFADAGDYEHALDEFRRVLRVVPDDGPALAGAGTSAFHLARYPLARTYLRRAPATLDDVSRTREVVDLVLSMDPLAARIGSAERRRRLAADLSYASERLSACAAHRAGSQPTADDATLHGEADDFQKNLKAGVALDQDTVEAGVALIDRVARHVTQTCGPSTPADEALVLIGRLHESNQR